MEIRIGRYRVQIGRAGQKEAPPDRMIDGERTDRDLALLAQAEREYRDTLWRAQSLLGN